METGKDCRSWVKGGICNHTAAPASNKSRCLLVLGKACPVWADTDHDQRNDEPTALANHQGDVEMAEQVEPVNPYPETEEPAYDSLVSAWVVFTIRCAERRAWEEGRVAGDASGYERGKAERDEVVVKQQDIIKILRAGVKGRDKVVAGLLEACDLARDAVGRLYKPGAPLIAVIDHLIAEAKAR